jgi:rod shape-determining protein MreD
MVILSDFTKRRVILQLKIFFSLFLGILIDQYSFFHFLPFQPSFFLIFLFFWTFFFPHQISFIIIFFLGLLADLIGGSLLGEHTLISLAFYGGISFYREYFTDNPDYEWAILWGATISIIAVHYILLWLIHKRVFFSIDHFIGHFFSLLFYPSARKFLFWLTGEVRD